MKMQVIFSMMVIAIELIGRVQNRMIVSSCLQAQPELATTTPREHVMSLTNKETKDIDPELEQYEAERQRINDKITGKKPCSIIVLSNVQNPNMQSLIRKYRYDARGSLIPSSVKYYFKLPQGLRTSPLLVPVNDKAFSPLGGFIRYYKEVPPIPQSW